jgi:hypothetical protein
MMIQYTRKINVKVANDGNLTPDLPVGYVEKKGKAGVQGPQAPSGSRGSAPMGGDRKTKTIFGVLKGK